jgi:hypothetical protein
MKNRTRIFFLLATSFIVLLIINACSKTEDEDPGIVIPTVETIDADSITPYTAIAGGTIISQGEALVTQKGICYSLYTNPTINEDTVLCDTGLMEFSCLLSDLQPAQTYYFKAFAINEVGVGYGVEKSFTTLENPQVLPTVETHPVAQITNISAICGGNVTNEGSSPVMAHGVCWSLSPEPTLSDHFTNDGEGGGNFQSQVTGLDPNTTYYIRAYATNQWGTTFGNETSFTTLNQ